MLGLTTLFSTILFGSMVFFVAVAAPVVHRTLEPEPALALSRSLFPRYFLWGIAVSALALACAAAAKSTLALPLGIVVAGFIYSRQLLMPQISSAKDQWLTSDSAQDKARYKALHKRSVIINGAQIFLLLTVVIAGQFFHRA